MLFKNRDATDDDMLSSTCMYFSSLLDCESLLHHVVMESLIQTDTNSHYSWDDDHDDGER